MIIIEEKRKPSSLVNILGLTVLGLSLAVTLVNGAGHYNKLSKLESDQNLFSACYEASREYEGENLFDKLVGINARNIYYRNNCKPKNHPRQGGFY